MAYGQSQKKRNAKKQVQNMLGGITKKMREGEKKMGPGYGSKKKKKKGKK